MIILRTTPAVNVELETGAGASDRRHAHQVALAVCVGVVAAVLILHAADVIEDDDRTVTTREGGW